MEGSSGGGASEGPEDAMARSVLPPPPPNIAAAALRPDLHSEHSSDDDGPKTFKDWAKVVGPHVGLVAVVGVYAVLGALGFQALESPHEERLRSRGVADLQALRLGLVEELWALSPKGPRPRPQPNWTLVADRQLNNLTQRLFTAFSQEFVVFGDLAAATNGSTAPGRHLWTTPAAIFFAATTMATIGYGNIVPVTSAGRVVCILFALLGAPLAIITIGDLGKFLSESTIWLYKQLRRLRDSARAYVRPTSEEKDGNVETGSKAGSQASGGSGDSMDELEEMLMDKTQVPVVLVFGILLIYIALGACLFAVLEGWGWLDAFYFCFITLTTVGFGDLVPEQHSYILLMLLYIGVGLAVTTMCIDLVGIQYIQKIHYFGRKFRGADLLAMLKRKRAIERQLALQQQDGLLHMYLHDQPTPEWRTPSPPSVYSSPKDWRGSFATVASEQPLHDPPSPSTLSTPSTSYSQLARARMYSDPLRSVEASSPSGPSVSIPCSIPTSPDVDERTAMYARRLTGRSSWSASGPSPSPPPISLDSDGSVRARLGDWWGRSPSATSYAYDFPLDLAAIAAAAKAARKHRSCPEPFLSLPPPPPIEDSVEAAVEPPLVAEVGQLPLAQAAGLVDSLRRDSAPDLQTSCLGTQRTPDRSHFLQRPTAARDEALAAPKTQLAKSGPQRVGGEDAEAAAAERALLVQRRLAEQRQPVEKPPVEVAASSEVPPAEPRQAKPLGLAAMEDWDSFQEMELASKRPRPPTLTFQSPSPPPEEEPPPLLSAVTTPLSSPGESEMEFGAFEILPESAVTAADLRTEDSAPLIFHEALPVHSVHHQTVKTETAVLSLLSCPEAVLADALPPFVVTENYCFIVDGADIPTATISGDERYWRHTSRPTKYYHSDDLRKFQKVNVLASRGKIISARFPKTRAPALVLGAGEGSSAVGAGPSPRMSVSSSNASSLAAAAASPRKEDSEASLTSVFKVIRFYSFWKTCTSFHRIVTLVEPVLEDETALVKKRFFIQYLWRNAKDSDKARVEREFDPAKQLTHQNPKVKGGKVSGGPSPSKAKPSPAKASSSASRGAPSTSRGSSSSRGPSSSRGGSPAKPRRGKR